MNVMNNELIWSPGQNFGVFFKNTILLKLFMKIIQNKTPDDISRSTYCTHTNSGSYSSTRPSIENSIRRPI